MKALTRHSTLIEEKGMTCLAKINTDVAPETLVIYSQFNGPIPRPEIIRKYGEIISDAPERILRFFEEDSAHARDIQMCG